MSAPEIDIAVHSALWPDSDTLIQEIITHTLQTIDQTGEISVVLGDDVMIRALNKTYRQQDKPTNVLSFPQDENGFLGDIILAYETIAREAQEQNKNFNHHLSHLLIHGTLHLCGYDHENEREAEEMEGLEIAILQKLGIKNPYEA